MTARRGHCCHPASSVMVVSMKTGTALRPPYPRLLRPGPGGAAAAAAVVLSALVAGTAVLVRLPVGSRWSLGTQGFALLAVMFVLHGLGSLAASG